MVYHYGPPATARAPVVRGPQVIPPGARAFRVAVTAAHICDALIQAGATPPREGWRPRPTRRGAWAVSGDAPLIASSDDGTIIIGGTAFHVDVSQL